MCSKDIVISGEHPCGLCHLTVTNNKRMTNYSSFPFHEKSIRIILETTCVVCLYIIERE